MCGGGYSFSMWQMWQMWQMLSKCILLDFPTDFLPQKPYLCTEISKRAEIANRRTSAANHPLTVRTLPAPPLKGGNFSPL